LPGVPEGVIELLREALNLLIGRQLPTQGLANATDGQRDLNT
jgi:hypothetical protein